MIFQQCGYLLNQHLLTKLLIMIEDLSKYASLALLFFSVGFRSITGSSTSSKQLLVGSNIMRHMKPNSDCLCFWEYMDQWGQHISITMVYDQLALMKAYHIFAFLCIDLTRFEDLDIWSDIFSKIFPIHCNPQCFFQMSFSGMLQIVVIPSYCSVFKCISCNHLPFFVERIGVFN